jgi:hypothetical protein
VVKRGARLGAGTSLADLDNSRGCSLVECYGMLQGDVSRMGSETSPVAAIAVAKHDRNLVSV